MKSNRVCIMERLHQLHGLGSLKAAWSVNYENINDTEQSDFPP